MKGFGSSLTVLRTQTLQGPYYGEDADRVAEILDKVQVPEWRLWTQHSRTSSQVFRDAVEKLVGSIETEEALRHRLKRRVVGKSPTPRYFDKHIALFFDAIRAALRQRPDELRATDILNQHVILLKENKEKFIEGRDIDSFDELLRSCENKSFHFLFCCLYEMIMHIYNHVMANVQKMRKNIFDQNIVSDKLFEIWSTEKPRPPGGIDGKPFFQFVEARLPKLEELDERVGFDIVLRARGAEKGNPTAQFGNYVSALSRFYANPSNDAAGDLWRCVQEYVGLINKVCSNYALEAETCQLRQELSYGYADLRDGLDSFEMEVGLSAEPSFKFNTGRVLKIVRATFSLVGPSIGLVFATARGLELICHDTAVIKVDSTRKTVTFE